jgi:3-phosphoglycerate kinase
MKIGEEIKKASALIRDVVYIGGLVAAIFLFTGKKAVEKEREATSKATQENTIKELTQTAATMILKIDTLMNSQTKIMAKMDANTKATNAVIVGFKKHLKATDRLEELLNFYEF